MARIATITKKEELAPEDQKVYDAIAQSRGVVGGPWLALLHSPEIAHRTMHLGSYVRFESTLDHKLVELAALVAARELECKHEWAAHAHHAQNAGIPMATVRAVYEKKGAEDFTSEDAQIVSFVREMITFPPGERGDVSGALRAAWRERLRRAGGDHRLLRHACVHDEYLRRLYGDSAGGPQDLNQQDRHARRRG